MWIVMLPGVRGTGSLRWALVGAAQMDGTTQPITRTRQLGNTILVQVMGSCGRLSPEVGAKAQDLGFQPPEVLSDQYHRANVMLGAVSPWECESRLGRPAK